MFVTLLAAGVYASSNLRIENEYGGCDLDTVVLEDGSNAFNTSCPIADVAALQQKVERLETVIANLTAHLESAMASQSSSSANLGDRVAALSSSSANASAVHEMLMRMKLQDGLLAYWPLDGTLFDHGGVAAMYAYNGGKGIANGRIDATGGTTTGVSYAAGIVRSAVHFSGGGHAVLANQVPSGTLLDFNGRVSVSVSYWLKGEPSAQGHMYVCPFSTNHFTAAGMVHQAHVPTIGQTTPVVLGVGVTPNCGCTFGEVIDGAWHHVTFTRDASAGRCYVDGAVVHEMFPAVAGSCGGMVMPDSASGGQTVQIAADNNAAGRHFEGALDEVKIWGRALSGEEVAAEYGRRA